MYFTIDNSIYNIGTAGYPQVQSIELGKNKTVNDPDFIWNVRYNALPNFAPHVGTLIVEEGNRLTDFISAAPISLMHTCSKRVRDIIRASSLGQTQFYPVAVRHEGIDYYDYYVMHCVNDYSQLVDFKRSIFEEYHYEGKVRVSKPFVSRSLREFEAYKDELVKNRSILPPIAPVEIRLVPGHPPLHDIFHLDVLGIETFISESLLIALLDQEVSGFSWEVSKIEE